ncbi:MAG TPA: PD-(D/E)XK nuclease family protein [Acidimicrobiia bacterium]
MAKTRIVPTVPGDPLRVSATAFMTYRQCPQRANARFQGYFGKPTVVSFVGSLAHQIFKRHLTVGPIEADEFEMACRQEMGKSMNLGNTLVELGLKPSELRGVVAQVRDLYERFVRVPQDGFTAAEVMFEIEAAEALTLVGQIDAVFGHGFDVRLVDWKTGALGEAEGQLMFYALLWVLENEQLPQSVMAVSVKTGETFSSEPSDDAVAELALEVGAMVDELRTAWTNGDELTRRGGPWCEYCPILGDCGEGAATMEMLSS